MQKNSIQNYPCRLENRFFFFLRELKHRSNRIGSFTSVKHDAKASREIRSNPFFSAGTELVALHHC